MFQISAVSCRSGSHISHFTYTQPRGTTHVLLSQNADYLNGLQGILTGNEPYSGEIALNGRRYAVQRAAFMTRTFRMYRGQTVIANVLTDLGFRQLGGKKGQRLFSALTEETGLSLDSSRTISQMTITEQKMVELLPANVGDPAARTGMEQLFDGAIQRIKCIAGVHDLLTMRKFGSTCEIGEIAGTVCEFYQNCAQTTLEAEPVRVPYAKAVSVALVINELVSNSIKHNQRLGRPLAVSIRVTQDDAAGQIVILYRDNGRGFPAQHPGAEAHSGAGSWILSSVVVYEFRGTMKQRNDGGAVVELRIPKKALLPLEKRRVASEELSTKAGGASG